MKVTNGSAVIFFVCSTCSRIFLSAFGQRHWLRKEAETGKTYKAIYYKSVITVLVLKLHVVFKMMCATSVSLRNQLSKSQLCNP